MASRPQGRGHRFNRLLDRWPTALALALSAATFGGTESAEGVASFASILVLLPLLYLVVAKLEARRATWPLLVAGIALVVVLRALDLVAPAAVFSALALIVLLWSVVDGHLFRSGTLQVQALGMLAFGALGLIGLAVHPDLARYLVAAGWFFHGVWDFVHLRRDKVVARSFAEWCGVIDVVIAIELIFKW
ncbi:hypothetical protein [Herbidospora daliensis]|uniref:hypothetical protein n=1 Tax=Herbidospora daliensis TaxID=295585 RepID=UPI00078369F0|nr:hypothetical protein [Herbidospora daliensis]